MGICCVPDCNNRRGKDSRSFYSIPKKPEDRRNAFLKGINRVNADGSTWIPNQNTRICSDHFLTGRKSEDPLKKNYLPTENMPKHPSSYWNRDASRKPPGFRPSGDEKSSAKSEEHDTDNGDIAPVNDEPLALPSIGLPNDINKTDANEMVCYKLRDLGLIIFLKC